MSENSTNSAFDRVVARLADAGRVLIVTHARPDGDGLGSMAGLAAAARAVGRDAALLVPSDVPERYAFLFPEGLPAGADRFGELAEAADLVIIVDTCAAEQLDGLGDALAAVREKVVVIDHHATADDIGSARWLDTSAAAAGVMTLEVIEALGWPVTAPAVEALLTAMATDTGWFRFANTDGRCLRAAAGLLDAGARADELYERLYMADRPERMDLLRVVLDGLELHHDRRIATMVVRRADFAATGARPDETENLVNEALRIGCVETAIFLAENPPSCDADEPVVRVSLRSRGGVDVSRVAASFGGGGHARAAGLRSTENIDVLKARLVRAVADRLG